jgi:glycerol kinase
MRDGLILSIDQGTTNTKALLVDRAGGSMFRIAAPVQLSVTAAGYVEQDAEALWASVCTVIEESSRFASQAGKPIEAVAISNQRETAVAWHADTLEPLANAVSWQCGRGESICNRLAGRAGEIRSKTGLPLAPLISASKWGWLIENKRLVQEAAAQGTLRLGTVDAWLMSKLTGGEAHATDLTNASRTGLLNLATLQWDSELLAYFGVPLGSLPALRDSCGLFGHCSAIAELEGVPILSAIGDSHGAMFGHGSYASGSIKATYGTGSSLMALTPSLIADAPKLARTIAWSIGGCTQFALEGNIAMTGSALQWVGEFLGLAEPAKDAALLAASVPDAAGIYFVPAMVGLGAPHWDAQARGTISGLGRAHTAAHLARAAVDAIAYQVTDVLLAMERAASMRFTELRADGGATRNDALMQFQADILGLPVQRSKEEELSALGAAWLAGLALGWWKSLGELSSLPQPHDSFVPQMTGDVRKRLYDGWSEAVAGARMHRGVTP